jgi:soluble lytic murein transglycosylase
MMMAACAAKALVTTQNELPLPKSYKHAAAAKPAATKPSTKNKATKPATSKTAHSPAASVKPAAKSAAKATTKSSAKGAAKSRRTTATHRKVAHRPLNTKQKAQSDRLRKAFVSSEQLRPMAQQLAQYRTPAGYAGVRSYAMTHTGDAAVAAWLALGHAHLADKQYPEAALAFAKMRTQAGMLADYIDFLGAQAELGANNPEQCLFLLRGFQAKYPDSIFNVQVPALAANASLKLLDPQGALRALNAAAGTAAATRLDYLSALAKAQLLSGQREAAIRSYRRIYTNYPLSGESQDARSQLAKMDAFGTLTAADQRAHADALYRAGRYAEASDEYSRLAETAGAANSYRALAALNSLKAKRLTLQDAASLPDTNDNNGALRLYLLMELARNREDLSEQQQLVEQLKARFPESQWLAEALYSSGNMYMLRKDYAHAVEYYSQLATGFPQNTNAEAAHWRAGWWSYRQGQYELAAKYFDQHLQLFPGSKQTAAALYWRGKIYADVEHQPERAATYYNAVVRGYQHFFYALQARQRLMELGNVTPAPGLDWVHAPDAPVLSDDVPQDDPHVVKAHLLSNAGLNEFIPQEISASEGSSQWGAYAEAEIYNSYGEAYRAMRVMKRAIPNYASLPITALPMAYWHTLFPQPYWTTLTADAGKYNLDPVMVASLIRQESEFNPAVISHANAYGLMQMLPSVGRQMAKADGMGAIDPSQLLNPDTNLRLGIRYLKQTLDKFGGVPEYAFAAYNAGDDRVVDWRAAGNYRSMDEFVESIPFTETREYVQAILRNEQIYREIQANNSAK